jgi:hypothetical protein
MKVKASEAKGRVLDYLVAQAMGMKIYGSYNRLLVDGRMSAG